MHAPEAREVEAAFWKSRVVQRQINVYEKECGCTRAMMRLQGTEHARLRRVVVIDGSLFRWEGLGNSGVRWMGLLRWGYSTGRATFLRLNRDCSTAGHFEAHHPSQGRPSDSKCHLDLGAPRRHLPHYKTGGGHLAAARA